ncbi:MAG: bifunctional phosphoglucose/phosphomannose isomerase [Balneolaceae bacterium]
MDNIREVDRDDMWGKLLNFPDQWQETMEFTKEVDWSIDRDQIRNICLSGMGGSAIGADLARAYTLNSCPVPVFVNRNYEIPNWVGAGTLFVACSFSGNTEETLSALDQALNRGAQVVAVTSGGKLLLEASREGYGYVKVPGGLPPRAALAYSFVPLFRLFNYLGYNDEGDEALDETADLLKEQTRLLSNRDENQALIIAREIKDTLPIIYTGQGLLDPVGLRWRGQFGENSKVLAYGNSIPEMNHNEIVGWEQTAHLTGRLSVVLLEDLTDHPKVKQRMQIVKEMVEGLAVYVTSVKSTGKSRLARQFSLVQLGDWVSIYLALINQVDPTPIAKIDLLKSRLAEL